MTMHYPVKNFESTDGASMKLNTVNIVEGGPIRIDSGSLTAGNA